MAHKVGGKGPGGCKGKEACLAYCDKEENAEECAKFAIEKGLVSEKEKELIQTGTLKIKEGLEKLPSDARPLVEQCLIGLIGADKFTRIKGGENIFLTKKQGEGIGKCFESVMAEYSSKKGGAGEMLPPDMPSNFPSIPPGSSLQQRGPVESQMPSVDCSSFANVPNCSLVGSLDSTAYKLCKKCFPDK